MENVQLNILLVLWSTDAPLRSMKHRVNLYLTEALNKYHVLHNMMISLPCQIQLCFRMLAHCFEGRKGQTRKEVSQEGKPTRVSNKIKLSERN